MRGRISHNVLLCIVDHWSIYEPSSCPRFLALPEQGFPLQELAPLPPPSPCVFTVYHTVVFAGIRDIARPGLAHHGSPIRAALKQNGFWFRHGVKGRSGATLGTTSLRVPDCWGFGMLLVPISPMMSFGTLSDRRSWASLALRRGRLCGGDGRFFSDCLKRRARSALVL